MEHLSPCTFPIAIVASVSCNALPDVFDGIGVKGAEWTISTGRAAADCVSVRSIAASGIGLIIGIPPVRIGSVDGLFSLCARYGVGMRTHARNSNGVGMRRHFFGGESVRKTATCAAQ